MNRRDLLKSRTAATVGSVPIDVDKAAQSSETANPVPGPQPNILFILDDREFFRAGTEFQTYMNVFADTTNMDPTRLNLATL